MTTPPTPTLDYRRKDPYLPLIQFQLISQPPRRDIFLLIRTAFILTSLAIYAAGGIHFRIGSTWYACIDHEALLLMHMHPNYAERFPVLAISPRPPEFVRSILYYRTWPYAKWIELPVWPIVVIWIAILAIIWHPTRVNKSKPATSLAAEHSTRQPGQSS
jgi:hypothetical protein